MHPFSLRLSQASTNLTYSKSSKVHISKPSVHLENSNKENVPDAANIDRYHNKKEEPTKRSSKYEASPGIDRRSPTNPLQSHNRNYNAMSTHLNNKLVLTSPKAGEAGPVKKESENNRILLKSLDNFLENKENRANHNSKESKAVKPGAKRVKEESTYSTKTREDQSTTRDTNSRLLSLAEDTAPEEMTIYTRLLTTTKPLTSKNKDSFMHNLEHNYYSPQHNMQKASMDLLAMTNQAKRAYLNGPTIDGRLHEHENHTKEDKGSSSDFQKLLKARTKLEQNHSKDKTTTTPKISQNEKNERYRHTQENFAQEKPKTRYPSTKKLSIDIQEPINIKERGSSKTDKDLVPNSGSYSKSKLAQSYTSLKKEMDSRGLLQKSPTLVEGEGSKYRTSLRDSSEVKVPFKLTSPKAESYEAIEMRRSMRSPKNFDKENNMPQNHSKNSGGQRGYYGSFVETDKEAEHNKTKEKLMGSYSQKKRPLSLVQNMHENETYGSSKKKEETRVLISPKQEKVNAPSLKDFVTQVNIGSGTLVSTPSEGRDSFSQQKRFDTISNKSTPKTQDLSEDSYFAHISKKHNKEKPPKAPHGRKDADLMWEKKTVPTKKITFRTEEDDHRSVARRTEAIAEVKERSADSSVYYMSSLEKYLRGTDVEEDYFQKIYKEHFFQGFQAINFCRYMKPVDMGELERKKVYLPRRDTHKDKKTLIFDLDETLIHCNEDPTMPCDAVIAIQFPHGDTIEAGINIRPYAMECLMELNKYYEIIVFTASHSCYANVALDYLDPEEKYIHHRLFRDHCMTTPEGLYIKDLRILANRDPKDVIIVDNAVYSFGFQLENGIPIIPFYFNKHDVELKSLTSYLKKLAHVPDVREMNKKVFKLHSYAGSESAEEVLTKLLNK